MPAENVKAPADQAEAETEGNYPAKGVHRSYDQSTGSHRQNAGRHPHIKYADDWYRVPDTEAEVWQWVDALNDDTRLSDEMRMFAGILAGLLVRAIRTGEGVTFR